MTASASKPPPLPLIQQVITAYTAALADLPDLQIGPVPGLDRSWRAAHCCQTLYVAADQPPAALLRSILDGITDMTTHARRATMARSCTHRDELAVRRHPTPD